MRIAVEHDIAVGEPGDVPRQRLAGYLRHPDLVQELTAHAARLKVDQSGGAHIERETSAPVVTRAAACLPVRFEHNRVQAACLKPRGGCPPPPPGPGDNDVENPPPGSLFHDQER